MKHLVFLKKEMMEIFKTSKIIVLPAIFLFFGFMSPLAGRYMNELLKSVGTGGTGIEIKMPDPTWVDSYAQFFKNLNSICIIAMILVFMGIVVDEKVRGSAVLVLTKCISRAQFVISKFFASVILFTVAYILSTAACMYYTYLLFPVFYNKNLPLAVLLFWIYGVLMISLTVFASTVGKTFTIAAVLGFTGFVVVSSSTFIPYIAKYTPGVLGGLSTELLMGAKTAGDAVIPITSALLLTVVFLVGTVMVLRRQEL